MFCSPNHDDVIKWKHFPRYWSLVRGIHCWTVNRWIPLTKASNANGWENNRDAGDLKRHRTNYNATVMPKVKSLHLARDVIFTHRRNRWRRILSSAIASVRPSVCPSVSLSVPERRYRSNSLRISDISLHFGGIMHSIIQQIALSNGHARQFLACSTELWNLAW